MIEFGLYYLTESSFQIFMVFFDNNCYFMFHDFHYLLINNNAYPRHYPCNIFTKHLKGIPFFALLKYSFLMPYQIVLPFLLFYFVKTCFSIFTTRLSSVTWSVCLNSSELSLILSSEDSSTSCICRKMCLLKTISFCNNC